MIIDSETIKSEIYSTPNYMTINDLDKNLFNMGRIIAVKFTNILDSLTYMTGEITVNIYNFQIFIIININIFIGCSTSFRWYNW